MGKVSAHGAGCYIKGHALVGFVELVEAAGGDPIALLKKAGFSRKALTELDGLISWPGLCVLVELAADELDKPSFGLEWALSIPAHFPNVGPTVLIAYFVKTFREWIEASIRYWHYHTNAFTLQLFDDRVSPDVVFRYYFQPPIVPARQQTEYMLGNACRMARIITGFKDENPSLVRFQHSKPQNTQLHEAIFKCPVEFEAAHNEIAFDRKLLAYPTNGNLVLFKGLMDRYIRYRIRQMPIYDQTMATTVGSAIRSAIGPGWCSAEFIANSLGLSAKKLQRLLSQEGTSFSKILDDVRHSMATRLLLESDMPISRLAGLLEYSTVAPFTLAFKRWTGVSPRAFRKGLPESLPNEPE